MRLLIVNGPNLNLLGTREKDIYGSQSFDSFLIDLRNKNAVEIDYFQSNVEGDLINCLQESDHDGIILNAGGYTHTSVALGDCVKGINTPVIEVHISNIMDRESYRHVSHISAGAIGCIFGFGLTSYQMAIDFYLNNR